MYHVFVRLLNMSLAASVLVLVVALLRLLLRKAPKRLICILWAFVAVRLLCPYSISSSISAFNLLQTEVRSKGRIEYFQYSENADPPTVQLRIPVPAGDAASASGVSADLHISDLYLLAVISIWLLGTVIMLVSALVSYLRLKKEIAASIPHKDLIYVCDEVKSPFILGVFHPVIYLPSNMETKIENNVIAHEMAHIRRRDHWWKPLGYLVLSVYWFNPVIWLAFILFCRDMEAACDEKVIEKMDREKIAEYSEALLSCAVKRRMITACPVAFGETDVKGRVMSVLNYRKPSFWILCTTVIAGVAVAAGFLTDPMPAQASGTARMAPELYTDYIGDASAVAAIAQSLPYPKDYSCASIELQTEKEPYELKIYLNGDGKLEENSFDDCFELAKERIGNLGILTFISNDTQEILAMYSKAEKESGISVEYETNSYDIGESISIIGGADGPTSIFLAGKLGGGSEEETGLKELLQTLMK